MLIFLIFTPRSYFLFSATLLNGFLLFHTSCLFLLPLYVEKTCLVGCETQVGKMVLGFFHTYQLQETAPSYGTFYLCLLSQPTSDDGSQENT